MSDERDLFGELDQMDGVPWEDIGRMNQEGYVDTNPIAENPRIFEDQFEMRSREKERTPPNLQPVTVVPNRAGPWSGNNQLGIEQEFAPDVNNRQTVLKLDEWGFPQMWTICLGITHDESLLNTDAFEVTALIQFGIGGVIQEIEVDWKAGTTISLPFNAVNIIALYNIIRVARTTPTIPNNLRLRASISKGTARSTNATRSFIFNEVNEDLTVEIPPFAESLHIAPTSSVDPPIFYSQPWNVRFRQNLGSNVCATQYRVSQFTHWLDPAAQLVGAPAWLPVPPFARYASVIGAAGVIQSNPCCFLFKLAF